MASRKTIPPSGGNARRELGAYSRCGLDCRSWGRTSCSLICMRSKILTRPQMVGAEYLSGMSDN